MSGSPGPRAFASTCGRRAARSRAAPSSSRIGPGREPGRRRFPAVAGGSARGEPGGDVHRHAVRRGGSATTQASSGRCPASQRRICRSKPSRTGNGRACRAEERHVGHGPVGVAQHDAAAAPGGVPGDRLGHTAERAPRPRRRSRPLEPASEPRVVPRVAASTPRLLRVPRPGRGGGARSPTAPRRHRWLFVPSSAGTATCRPPAGAGGASSQESGRRSACRPGRRAVSTSTALPPRPPAFRRVRFSTNLASWESSTLMTM